MGSISAALFITFGIALGVSLPLAAETSKAPPGIGVDQKLSARIPLDLTFKNEAGNAVKLRDFFNGKKKPIILVPGYYRCPRLCSLIYNAVGTAVKGNLKHELKPGEDYDIISISVAPEETPELAAAKGKNYRKSLELTDMPPTAWRFLTGDAASIKSLTTSLGYRYRKDGDDYTHPAATIILTPTGVISRYLDGLDIRSQDFRFALIEASGGRIGTVLDRAFQLCFRYDSTQGKYTPYARRFVQLGGILTLVFLVGLILFLMRYERKA